MSLSKWQHIDCFKTFTLALSAIKVIEGAALVTCCCWFAQSKAESLLSPPTDGFNDRRLKQNGIAIGN